jgi:hypothetical protein
MKLANFPHSVAEALGKLTSLNQYKGLPAALSHMTSLNAVDISCNNSLALERSDLGILAMIPHLGSLQVETGAAAQKSQTNSNVGVLLAISRHFPNLALPCFD